MTPPNQKRGLGRGLSALLGPDANSSNLAAAIADSGDAANQSPLRMLALSLLKAGQYQPRTRMDEGALQELAASIKQHGIMQPIVVRALSANSTTGGSAASTSYEIIAGERRFRAAKIAGLNEVPVIIKQVADQDALALALIENIQREDLSPLEEAQAIKRLLDEFRFTHEQAAESIGRSRSATSNLLRLLNLAEPVQTMLNAGDLDMGHARALLALPALQQITCAQQIVQRQLTVRDAEKLVAKELADDGSNTNAKKTNAAPEQGRDIQRLAEKIADTLNAKVQLQATPKGKGKLVIQFSDHDNFEGVLQRLGLAELLKD